jgi:hypothetical protein
MFLSAIGHAECIDNTAAAKEIIRQCKNQLNGKHPNAGILFSANQPDQASISNEISQAFPGLPLSGCPSGCEMSEISGFKQDSVCLILFVSDAISISSGGLSMIHQIPSVPLKKP